MRVNCATLESSITVPPPPDSSTAAHYRAAKTDDQGWDRGQGQDRGGGLIPAVGKTWYVNVSHPGASDAPGSGTETRPFRSISPAAALAQPGDTVLAGAWDKETRGWGGVRE